MDNFLAFLGCFYLIPSLIIGGLGFLLGWFLKPRKKVVGDLSLEGEGALRSEVDSQRAKVQDLEARLASRDTEMSDLKTKLAAAAAGAAAAGAAATVAAKADTAKTTDDDDSYALEWQNRYLAARVKYLESRVAEDAEAAKAKPASKPKATSTKKKAAAGAAALATAAVATKAAAKPKAKAKPKTKALAKPRKTAVKTTAKPSAGVVKAKKAPVKKAPAKTTGTKAAAVKKAPAKKAPAKKPAAKKMTAEEAKFERYYTNVKTYDARASREVVKNIVKYCGVALKSRDSSLVACSDEAELLRVAKGFVTKKLEMKDGQMDLVKDVCAQMKGQRQKSRVTFYYLAAKKAKKLSVFK